MEGLEQIGEGAGRRDGLAIDRDDGVTFGQPALLCRRARDHRADHCPCGAAAAAGALSRSSFAAEASAPEAEASGAGALGAGARAVAATGALRYLNAKEGGGADVDGR